MIACHSRREHEAIFGAAEGSPLVLCSEGDLSPGMANRAGQADVSAILRVSDHTDEGSGGDSQKPAVNDSVLYHSRLGLASGERFWGELCTNGRPFGRSAIAASGSVAAMFKEASKRSHQAGIRTWTTTDSLPNAGKSSVILLNSCSCRTFLRLRVELGSPTFP